MIQIFAPSLGQEELGQIAESFRTGWIGKGPKVTEFEAAWAAHIGVNPKNVVSVNSCTEGIFQAVRLLGIGPGDEVIIPTIHFVGAAQAVIDAGARPVFCDVDNRTLNTNDEFLTQKITGRTRAIILNHYGGVPCNLDYKVWANFRKLGGRIFIIEDAACAPASTYNGQTVGTFGDIGLWSFDAMKIISIGDGGMMHIRDEELADRARKQLYLGTNTDSGLRNNTQKWWEFEVQTPGARRSIMNDIAAGIGLEQLRKLSEFVDRRLRLHGLYNELLFPNPLNFKQLSPCDIMDGSHYFYWIQTPRRDELAHYLREQDVYTTFRYYPLHWAYKTGDSLPNAEKAARETLLLPLHCGLSDEDVEFICRKIRDFFANV